MYGAQNNCCEISQLDKQNIKEIFRNIRVVRCVLSQYYKIYNQWSL